MLNGVISFVIVVWHRSSNKPKKYFDKTDLIRIDKLLAHIDDYLVEPEAPALLHGDLWSGELY